MHIYIAYNVYTAYVSVYKMYVCPVFMHKMYACVYIIKSFTPGAWSCCSCSEFSTLNNGLNDYHKNSTCIHATSHRIM